jgi:hypothetical protein
MNDKRLTDQQLLGTQGTGLIELLVSSMGFAWRPTAQHDAGIDGEIEVRDTSSGRMTGMLIKVQSKAVSAFQNETEEGFDYWPEARDLRYWLEHNIPVILIISRPVTKEAYWMSVRDQIALSPQSKKFHFVKLRDRLDDSAQVKLIALAQAVSPASTSPVLPKQEWLVSNLLPVTQLPEQLYFADTSLRDSKEVGEILRSNGLYLEFILRGGKLLTVRNLCDPQYHCLCSQGRVWSEPVHEWSASSDPAKQRDFVALMNRCLREFLHSMPEALRFDNTNYCYYFPPSPNKEPYNYSYRGDKKSTAREVFKERINKRKNHVMGYRHSAMKAKFFRFDDAWYLEVTPTYLFTSNGYRQSKWHAEWLKGIKEFEKNLAVRGQLMMWADILLNPPDLFGESYPFLGFGAPLKFKSSHGIDDIAWTASDPTDQPLSDHASATLFELL